MEIADAMEQGDVEGLKANRGRSTPRILKGYAQGAGAMVCDISSNLMSMVVTYACSNSTLDHARLVMRLFDHALLLLQLSLTVPML